MHAHLNEYSPVESEWKWNNLVTTDRRPLGATVIHRSTFEVVDAVEILDTSSPSSPVDCKAIAR